MLPNAFCRHRLFPREVSATFGSCSQPLKSWLRLGSVQRPHNGEYQTRKLTGSLSSVSRYEFVSAVLFLPYRRRSDYPSFLNTLNELCHILVITHLKRGGRGNRQSQSREYLGFLKVFLHLSVPASRISHRAS